MGAMMAFLHKYPYSIFFFAIACAQLACPNCSMKVQKASKKGPFTPYGPLITLPEANIGNPNVPLAILDQTKKTCGHLDFKYKFGKLKLFSIEGSPQFTESLKWL